MTNPTDPLNTSRPPEVPEAPHRQKRPINMVAGTIGHFVEWYDWYIYGLLAAVFAGQIFPSHSTFRLPSRSAADLRDRVCRPPLQRDHHLATGRPLRPTGHPDAVRLRDGARLADHRPHPSDLSTIGYAAPILFVHRPHPARHLGRQRAAKRHLVHGRTRPPEQERPVRILHQHGKRPRHPRSDRFRRDRDSTPSLRTRSPTGVGASPSSSAASSAWSVSSCGPAPTRPPSSRQASSSIKSPRRRD